MSENQLTYEDVKAYEKFFTLTPAFLLERFAKKNTNLVLKFESKVDSFVANMSDGQKAKMDILLESDIEDLQLIMAEAYHKTRKKQYKILANPKYKGFIEKNLTELGKKVKN